jgi:polyisoprenoid-binding protein YceI
MYYSTRNPVLCVLAVLALIFIQGCSDPTEGKPAAVVHEVAAEASQEKEMPAEPTEASLRFVLGKKSTLDFVGSKVTGSHDGGFTDFSGAIMVPNENLAEGRVEIRIQMNSIFSDAEKLTGHLKSPDFFDVEKHPESSFNSTAITKQGDGFVLTGDLTLHGVTQSISFPATIKRRDNQIIADAEFSINRSDFKIVYPGKPNDLIREKVLIRLHIEATSAS